MSLILEKSRDMFSPSPCDVVTSQGIGTERGCLSPVVRAQNGEVRLEGCPGAGGELKASYTQADGAGAAEHGVRVWAKPRRQSGTFARGSCVFKGRGVSTLAIHWTKLESAWAPPMPT